MSAVREVLMPTSEAEAVELFGDGVNVTVIGGGTIVVPSVAAGRLAPPRAMFLGKAGLDGISRNGATITIGATTSVASLAELAAPLGPCAENVADPEVRAQATVGGNLCAAAHERGAARRPAGRAARARRPGALRRRRRRAQRVARALPRGTRWAPAALGLLRRARRRRVRVHPLPPHPHLHGARGVGRAIAGRRDPPRGDRGRRHADAAARCRARRGRSRRRRRRRRLARSEFADDALASAWYRTKTLPVLVRRALTTLKESA